jgi:lysophospholipase L1-like esterase
MVLTFGDSVTWGQGLLDVHKFDRLYAGDALLPRSAHSGAIIGSSADNSKQKEYPEVPVPYPSAWQQVAAVEDWTDVDMTIINGGINDVSLTRILNPVVPADHIGGLTQQFCLSEMTKLLTSLTAHLTKPGARVAVIGYYPILSEQSSFENEKQPRWLMESHGVATSSTVTGQTLDIATLVPRVVENCITFWKVSTESLKSAVDAVNAGPGPAKCLFIDTGFDEANALWGPNSLLWELSPSLDPEDEVTELRSRACDALYGDLVHLPEWGQWAACNHASVGHPNVQGAAQIAMRLTGLLSA